MVVWLAVLAGQVFADDWCYVEPANGTPLFRPISTTLRLSDQPPPDMQVEAAFIGTRQRFGQIRYGSEDSIRVIVVIDEQEDGTFDLYLDADRDRTIHEDDLMAENALLGQRERRCSLDAETIPELLPRRFARSIILRRLISGDSLSLATAGVMQGTVQLGERAVACVRIDGDTNGLFANAADRVWIDVNDDGQWDPISEQFSIRPLIRIGDERFALRADELGERISLDPIVGQGRMKLTLLGLAEGASVQSLNVMLRGDDGSAYSVSGVDSELELPIGRYALTAVSLSINDGKSNNAWQFVFSHASGLRQEVWYDIADGQELTVDVIGELNFSIDAPDGARGRKPGEPVSVQPWLFTGDGLLINSCIRGDGNASWLETPNQARLTLVESGKEAILDSLTTGFQ